jgi:hypothetical protein
MRALPFAAFSLLLLPGMGCINLDLANGKENVFESEVDANGAGFRKKNIKFKQIITLDPSVDEQVGGAFAVDTINFEPLKIEFAYLLEEMNRLEDLVSLFVEGDGAVATDPRGLEDNFNVFQVGDFRDKPFVVEMFVTYTRKEIILEERRFFPGRFKKNRIRTVETKPAFCNFLDPKDVNAVGCFTFAAGALGVNIGQVAGVGKDINGDGVLLNVDNDFDGFANAEEGDDVEIETTSSATFKDLIVVDNVIYLTLLEEFLEVNNGGPLNGDQIEEIADQAIMVRLARDEVGTLTIFNNNLGRDFR